MTNKVVIATGNQGKLAEIQRLFMGWDVVPQSDFNFPPVEETGLTFVENAILKARQACEHTGLAALADDSGLEVGALDGQPGIYSARYAGANASDTDNINKLLLNLERCSKRDARFRCVVVYMRHHLDPSPIICSGTWEGHISNTVQGKNGFGYDPIFIPDGYTTSAAELSKEEKNQISHRGQALAQLKLALRT